MTATAHSGLGNYAAAIRDCADFAAQCLRETAIAEMKLGHVEQAHQALAKLQAEFDGPSIDNATVYAQWNDRPAALHWLAIAAKEHGAASVQIREVRELDPIRDSPEYRNLERAIGLPP